MAKQAPEPVARDAQSLGTNSPANRTEERVADRDPRPAAPEEAKGQPAPTEAAETPKAEAKAAAPGQHKVNVATRDIINSSLQTIGHQDLTQITQNIERVLIGDATLSARFSMEMAISVEEAFESGLSDLVVCEETFLAESLTLLQQNRIAFVIGPAENGKGAITILLASMLRRRDGDLLYPAQVVAPPLASQIKVDLRRLTEESDHVGHRVVIFRDAFARRNRDLLEFFGELSANVVHSLQVQLEKARAYLIFTSDTDLIPPQCVRSLPPNMIFTVQPASEGLLKEGLERRLIAFAKKNNIEETELLEKIPFKERERIVALGRTMVRVSQFVQWYLPEVLRGDVSLEQAFARLETQSMWFQSDLAKDIPAWIFAFCIVLLQATETGDGVPWQEFYLFHEAAREHILNWVLPQGKGDRPDHLRMRPLSDQELLDRSRTHVRRDPAAKHDVIGFQDQENVSALWDSLLESNRSLLSSLIPLLEKTAEHAESVSMRGRAAQALGRIGEVDPWRTTRRLARKWSEDSEFSTRALVGYLFQGVRASRTRSYVDVGTQILDDLSRDPRRVWTALAAYKQIGTTELPYAMSCLRKIAEKHMAVPLENAHEIERDLYAGLEEALNSADPNDLDLVSRYYKALFAVFQTIFAEDRENAISLQYTLVSLCITNGPVPVYVELRKWMAGNRGLKALVSVIFLQDKGIALELSRHPEEIEIGEGDRPRKVPCDPTVVAMASSSSAVQIVAEFLEDVFVGYRSFFTSQTWRYLHQMFFNHLKAWARGAMASSQCRAAVEDLFSRLLRTMYPPLNDEMLHWLQSDADFVTGELKALREAVIGGSLAATSLSAV
jgi:hypothetical protein